jgi:HD superfamily phosphohydrolase
MQQLLKVLCDIENLNTCQVVYLVSHKNEFFPKLNYDWTKVSYKRGTSTQEGTQRDTKHAKASDHRFNQTSSSNRYTALLEESEDQQQKAGPSLAQNQIKVQPKTSESYKTIIKALAEKRKEFHMYKIKEERSYRVVLKICTLHHPEEIKTQIKKLGHTVTNIWNIKQYRTKQPEMSFISYLLFRVIF